MNQQQLVLPAGLNVASGNGNAGTVPHNTDVGTYRMSTGFEAILGALYLEKKEERIREIWTKVRSLQGE